MCVFVVGIVIIGEGLFVFEWFNIVVEFGIIVVIIIIGVWILYDSRDWMIFKNLNDKFSLFFFWLENSNEEYKRIFFFIFLICKIVMIKMIEYNRIFMFFIDFCFN